MRNPRHARCSAAIAPAAVHRSDWPQTGIRFHGPVKIGRSNGRTPRTAGTGLSKACPLPEPFNRARPRQACLIFDLELFDIGGGGLWGPGPFRSFLPAPKRLCAV